jgi:hypothetical protein
MHTGGGERGRRLAPHVPPNHIEKFGLKNVIKTKIEEPPPTDFLKFPSTPIKKI